MNEKGKLNPGIIGIGLICIIALFFGAYAIASGFQDDSIPKAPILQADSGQPDETPSADDKEADKEKKSEQKPAEEAKPEKKAPVDPLQFPADAPAKPDDGRTNREKTPTELSSLGIYFKDAEGSEVAAKTEKILNVNLPTAMQRKNDQARSFQTMNMEGRTDPLYVTDLIPDALRPELEGEGISGAVDSGLIDQLIQTQISTYFKYMPINIIGTMQNGPYKSVLMSIPAAGYYGIMQEGQTENVTSLPGDKGYYVVSMTIAQVTEDHVSINLWATEYDFVYNRVITSTPVVTRHFYIRRYQ
jgi:hypothetical protein